MFNLVAFLVLQIMVSLLVNAFSNTHWRMVFRSYSYPLFGILIVLYPLTIPAEIADAEHGSGGLAGLGIRLFLWIAGIPSVMLLQFLLNRFIVKKPTNQNNNP